MRAVACWIVIQISSGIFRNIENTGSASSAEHHHRSASLDIPLLPSCTNPKSVNKNQQNQLSEPNPSNVLQNQHAKRQILESFLKISSTSPKSSKRSSKSAPRASTPRTIPQTQLPELGILQKFIKINSPSPNRRNLQNLQAPKPRKHSSISIPRPLIINTFVKMSPISSGGGDRAAYSIFGFRVFSHAPTCSRALL